MTSERLDETLTGNPPAVPMDLAGFLLDRWTEEAQLGQRAVERWGLPHFGRGALEHSLYWSPERVLAQLSALQWILEDHLAVHELVGQLQQRQQEPCTCHLLRCLARPYAGHPEYVDEWAVTE